MSEESLAGSGEREETKKTKRIPVSPVFRSLNTMAMKQPEEAALPFGIHREPVEYDWATAVRFDIIRNMSEISVIIPCYNVRTYINQCLDSIVNQTFSDIEIIIVDDGATDGSGKIADDYAERDSRIRVIHKENGGLSSARNAGMNIASSPYLMFLDGDDYVDERFCEIPYRLITENNADIVCFEFERVPSGIKSGFTEKPRMFSNDEVLVLLSGWKISDSACNKIYRREMFDTIRFPEGYVYEDMGTAYRLFEAAERIYITDQVLYYYRDTPGSISKNIDTRTKSDVRVMQEKKFAALLGRFVQDREVFRSPYVLNYAFEYLVTREPGTNRETEQYADAIVRRLSRLRKTLSPDKQRLFWLYLHCRPLFHLLCRAKKYR